MSCSVSSGAGAGRAKHTSALYARNSSPPWPGSPLQPSEKAGSRRRLCTVCFPRRVRAMTWSSTTLQRTRVMAVRFAKSGDSNFRVRPAVSISAWRTISGQLNSGEVDVVALQVVTVGDAATRRFDELQRAAEYSEAFYMHGLAVETAEAVAEWLHRRIRSEWGLVAGQGKRYSWGYGACPDLDDHATVFRLLPAAEALACSSHRHRSSSRSSPRLPSLFTIGKPSIFAMRGDAVDSVPEVANGAATGGTAGAAAGAAA